jgi:hypothetical protein
VSIHFICWLICFPSLSDSDSFLTLTPVCSVCLSLYFSESAYSPPPLGDLQRRAGARAAGGGGVRVPWGIGQVGQKRERVAAGPRARLGRVLGWATRRRGEKGAWGFLFSLFALMPHQNVHFTNSLNHKQK